LPRTNLISRQRNRVLVVRCSEVHVAVFSEKVEGATPGALALPRLRGLIGTLRARRATALTFNQDALVELAVRADGPDDVSDGDWGSIDSIWDRAALIPSSLRAACKTAVMFEGRRP